MLFDLKYKNIYRETEQMPGLNQLNKKLVTYV